MMRAGYLLWNQGEIEAVVERCLADDVEFHLGPEWPGLNPSYRGAGEVAQFLRDDIANVIGLRGIEIEREAEVGEAVIFALRTEVRGEMSGVKLGEVPIFHVVRVEGGKVKRIDVFLDEAEAFHAAKER